MIYESKKSFDELYQEISLLVLDIQLHERDSLYRSNHSVESKNASHPPIEYYRDKINVNVTYNNNINININTQPPKKPWNKILDVILTIVKLITLIVSLYSLGDSDDDSSDNNLRLQLG